MYLCIYIYIYIYTQIYDKCRWCARLCGALLSIPQTWSGQHALTHGLSLNAHAYSRAAEQMGYTRKQQNDCSSWSSSASLRPSRRALCACPGRQAWSVTRPPTGATARGLGRAWQLLIAIDRPLCPHNYRASAASLHSTHDAAGKPSDFVTR